MNDAPSVESRSVAAESSRRPERSKGGLPSFLGAVVDALSSTKLTVVLLVILLYLTWQGTLAQVQLGLYESQQRYFNSLIAWDPVLKIPLPGGYLVLLLFSLNLTLGGIVRLRKGSATWGILIGHLGIALLMLAGAVNFHAAHEGYVRFHEGEVRDEVVSYHEWEIAIREVEAGATWTEWIVPHEEIIVLRPQDHARFTHRELPFALAVTGFARNVTPRPAQPADSRATRVVDGYVLERLALSKESEENVPGCYATFEVAGGTASEAVLFGLAEHPATVRAAGRTFLVALRNRRYPLDFALRLDRFHTSTHPGIDVARDFSSDVTRIEDGVEHSVLIKMNEPLRHAGYIFYQSKFSEPDAWSNGSYYSILAAVKNPSDQWPMWSCIVIGLGLVVHFGSKLLRYARNQASRRTSP